ncbi:MAG: AraC-like DNA-binding protein [Glaciecola sp.]
MALINVTKYKQAFLVLLCTLVLSAILILKNESSFNLLVNQNVYSSSYTDENLEGNSTCTLQNDSGLNFTYTLGEKYLYAFAGISIDAYNNSESETSHKNILLDLSQFETMQFDMESKHGKKIPVQVLTFLKGHSVEGDNNTLIFYEQFLEYNPDLNIQTIPLERFAIPNWWRKTHPNVKTEQLKVALKSVKAINVQSCIILPRNKVDNYDIKSMHFTSKNYHFATALIIGIVFSTFLFVVTYLKQKKMLVISYKEIESKNTTLKSSQGNEILNYINENYSEAELSVESIEKSLRLSTNKLGEILKKETNLSFKQYLNSIRILEAKRLLSETELSISEIAYHVGYSNVSHFNRVFKNLENCSPSAFREHK